MNMIVITREGAVRSLYDETLDLSPLGRQTVRRASNVEPDRTGRWFADMSPVEGPVLGPFLFRSEALAAEIAWLVQHGLPNPRSGGITVPHIARLPEPERDASPRSMPVES